MKSLTKPLKDIAVLTTSLTLAFILALAASFVYGAWSNPPAAAPGSNVAAPVNVGGDRQTKSGTLNVWTLTSNRIVANSVKSGIMRSALYCDENGQNCIAQADLGGAAAASGCAATSGYGYTRPALNHLEVHVKVTGDISSCSAITKTLHQCIDGIVKTMATWKTGRNTCGA
jgi:hypothetical protein